MLTIVTKMKVKSRSEREIIRYVGLALKRLREKRHWTQEGVAESAGISRIYLGQVELGKRDPSITVLWRIAAALGVSGRGMVDEVSHLVKDHGLAKTLKSGAESLRPVDRAGKGGLPVSQGLGLRDQRSLVELQRTAYRLAQLTASVLRKERRSGRARSRV